MPLAATQPVAVSPVATSANQDMILPVPFVSQEPYKELCWAACGSMIFQYYHMSNVDVLDLASKISKLDCQMNPMPIGCDSAAWPCDLYTAYGFTCQRVLAPLTLRSIRACIADMQPIQPYFQWNDDEGNHTVLIVGCYANDDLLVYDPDPMLGTGRQSYQTLLYAYGRGSWQRTWYNIMPSNAALA
jgi:hypothetical protein